MAEIRVGTCSWADDSFVKAYYPKGVDRLAYYADRFDVVEANSTYYRLPDEEIVARHTDLDEAQLLEVAVQAVGLGIDGDPALGSDQWEELIERLRGVEKRNCGFHEVRRAGDSIAGACLAECVRLDRMTGVSRGGR